MYIKTRKIPTFNEIEMGKETLSVEQQTIIAELSIMNCSFLDQLRMPMVADGMGGKKLVMFFQGCFAAMALTIINAELISVEFYKDHKTILDAAFGIKRDVELSCLEVYQFAYDIQYMLGLYLAAMGLDDEIIPRYNEYYHDNAYFKPVK